MLNKSLSAAILAVLSLHAHAETRLKPIITASRVAQTVDQTLTAVSVITSDDINNSQSDSLPELLRLLVPGLDFSTTGGSGHQVSAFLRGTSSDQVLVLIDGNIIGSATTGATALELLPLQQIERIEIIRGSRSVLYGSDAIGGVIQIFTKSGEQQSTASVTLGSHSTRAAEASLNMHSEKSDVTLVVNHYKTDGFDVTNDNEDDDDGYQSSSVNLSVHQQLNRNTSMHARVLHAIGETAFDNNSFGNVSDSIQQSVNIGINSNLSDTWSTSVDLGQTKDRLKTDRYTEDFFTPGTFNFEQTLFDTQRQQARWQNRINFSHTGVASLGIDYIDDAVVSTTNYAVNSRNNKGVYVLVQDKFGNHQLQLSGRIDNNEAFGSHRTAGVAWSYDINGSISSNLSHSTAFIAPTFNDLYFVDPFFFGNPNLNPETSHSTEFGLLGNTLWGSWDLRLYQTEIDNLIINVSSDPTDPFAAFTTANANQAKIDGVELAINTNIADWNHALSFSYVDAKNESNNTVLQNRAKRTLKVRSSGTVSDHHVSLEALVQSARFADVGNTQVLAGYGIVNIAVAKPVHNNWTVKAKLENVFNISYSTSTDFFGNTTNNTPRSFFITLVYQR